MPKKSSITASLKKIHKKIPYKYQGGQMLPFPPSKNDTSLIPYWCADFYLRSTALINLRNILPLVWSISPTGLSLSIPGWDVFFPPTAFCNDHPPTDFYFNSHSANDPYPI